MNNSDDGDARDGQAQEQASGVPVTTDSDRSDSDPRNISDQSEEHNAQARGAEVELSPQERHEQVKSAAPEGGEIQDLPDEPARESERDAQRAQPQEENGSSGGGRGSRVSVVDESPPRPQPPEGESDDEYKWHTYKVYPSGRPDAVEFIDTYKSFGRSHILQGLNMGLPEGMVSMILGPSGTGKSVCIKHMVGLLYPDKGDILVHGQSVPNMPDDDLFDMRKKFGLLFQDGALFGSMNLFDNVAFPLRQHTEKSEDEVGDIVMRRLNEVGLGSARAKMPNELSGGMRKRAGFARALVLEPDIVLFDEPDSGLDPVRTALLGELILEIHRDMMDEAKEKQREHLPTFCVITHDIMSARRVADYINVLWKGRIVEAGPAEDMLNSENPFIRQFLSGESQGPLTMD
jgi:phospholipid/cholesterol/gamma-HCH transport system ATP-binding protein